MPKQTTKTKIDDPPDPNESGGEDSIPAPQRSAIKTRSTTQTTLQFGVASSDDPLTQDPDSEFEKREKKMQSSSKQASQMSEMSKKPVMSEKTKKQKHNKKKLSKTKKEKEYKEGE